MTRPTIILKPGQRITYSGFPGAVIRHYDGNMYEIRLASGSACVDAGDLVPVESATIAQRIVAEDAAFFDDAFTNPTTKEPYDVPKDLRRLSERLCRSYGIRGCCDPMYIANVIAVELGLGDGYSNFKPEAIAS